MTNSVMMLWDQWWG